MQTLGRALGYLRPYWRSALGALISLLLVSAANLVTPQILRVVIDQGVSLNTILVTVYAALALVVVAIVRGVFSFGQTYLSEKASQGAAYDMRNALFSRLQRLSFSYHEQAQTGQLMTHATSDVDLVRNFTGMGFLQFLNAGVLLIGSVVILLSMNWRLALVAFLLIPAIMAVFIVFFRVVGPRFRMLQIIKRGTHDGLIAQQGLYAERYQRQFRDVDQPAYE